MTATDVTNTDGMNEDKNVRRGLIHGGRGAAVLESPTTRRSILLASECSDGSER